VYQVGKLVRETIYESGIYQIEGNYSDSLNYTFKCFYNNGNRNAQGRVVKSHERVEFVWDDSTYRYRAYQDVYKNIEKECNICVGKWNIFYPDEKLRETGTLDTTYDNHWFIEDNISVVPGGCKREHEPILVVRDGWKYYSTDGSLEKEIYYNKGRNIK
jgi:hypothetical protein